MDMITYRQCNTQSNYYTESNNYNTSQYSANYGCRVDPFLSCMHGEFNLHDIVELAN